MKKIFLILFIFIFSFSFVKANVYNGEISQINNSQIILNKTGLFNSLFNFIGFKNQEVVDITSQTKYFLKQNNQEIDFHNLKIGMNVVINTQEPISNTKFSEPDLKTNTSEGQNKTLSLFDFFNSKIQDFSLPTVEIENTQMPQQLSQCKKEVNYVCGKDGKTYLNECMAVEAKTTIDCQGKCPCKKIYTFNFLNIFNTTTTTQPIKYTQVDDEYVVLEQEKIKKTTDFLKHPENKIFKGIKEKESDVNILVYPNKAIPNETIALSIDLRFFKNRLVFPIHDLEFDGKYSSQEEFEKAIQFTILLKDKITGEVVATIKNKNRDDIKTIQTNTNHLGFTFRIVYDENYGGYVLSSPYKVEHNKNTEIISPIKDAGWKTDMDTLINNTFTITNKKPLNLNREYVFEVQKDHYYYETISDYVNQIPTKMTIKKTKGPNLVVQKDWLSDGSVAYFYTVDNIPLSLLTTDPRGVYHKTEDICDGGSGVDESIKRTRFNFRNIANKYTQNPPNSQQEINNLKTIQHLPNNKEIPFTWNGDIGMHYRITQNLNQECIGELKTKNSASNTGGESYLIGTFSKKTINSCEPTFCHLDIKTYTITCDILALNKLCNNDETYLEKYHEIAQEKELCWTRDTTDLCRDITDPLTREKFDCLDSPKEICESKKDTNKEYVWEVKRKYRNLSISDDIYRKPNTGKYRYITTYKNIFNRNDTPDENFCFNGEIVSNYLSDKYSKSIKYYVDNDLTSMSSLSKNEWKFSDLIGRIISLGARDKVGILCYEYAPNLYLDY